MRRRATEQSKARTNRTKKRPVQPCEPANEGGRAKRFHRRCRVGQKDQSTKIVFYISVDSDSVSQQYKASKQVN
jgi:hypothetical protein